MMSIWWVCPPHQARAVRPGWPGAAPSPEPGHDPNPAELIEYPPRIRGCWLFVHADVPVIGCSRFLTETSWRTMDGETGTKGRPFLPPAGTETCGGVMVRGPNSGDGTQSPVYYLASAGLGSTLPRPRALDEIDPLAGAGTGPVTAPAGSFPVTLAEAYAADFGRVFLNFSPQNQGQREQQLAAFVPASVAAANPDLGWNGIGQMSLQSEQVAGITMQDPAHAVVTLLASVNGQLMELGVPVAASGSGVVVSGEPAWLPAPAQIPLPAPAGGSSDPVAHSQLMNELPAFFKAYANGDSAAVNRFLAPGVRLAGLGGTMAFDSISGLHVPSGGSTRQITVAVIWQPLSQGASSGAKLQVTYSMSVVQQSSVKWYVKEISASIEAVGAQ